MTTPEALTDEERAYALKRGVHMPEDVELFAKLVRIHDRLEAENRAQGDTIAGLEDEDGETAQELIDAEKRHLAEALDLAQRIAELETENRELRAMVQRVSAAATRAGVPITEAIAPGPAESAPSGDDAPDSERTQRADYELEQAKDRAIWDDD